MLLQTELKETISRLEKIKPDIIKYAKALHNSKKYNSFEVRILYDCLRVIYSTDDVWNWHDKYNCKDKHITSLMRKAFLTVFNIKEVKDILKMEV